VREAASPPRVHADAAGVSPSRGSGCSFYCVHIRTASDGAALANAFAADKIANGRPAAAGAARGRTYPARLGRRRRPMVSRAAWPSAASDGIAHGMGGAGRPVWIAHQSDLRSSEQVARMCSSTHHLRPHVHPSIHPAIHPPIHPSAHLPICKSIHANSHDLQANPNTRERRRRRNTGDGRVSCRRWQNADLKAATNALREIFTAVHTLDDELPYASPRPAGDLLWLARNRVGTRGAGSLGPPDHIHIGLRAWRIDRGRGADVGGGEPSPGADVGGVGPVPTHAWLQPSPGCRRGEPNPSAAVARNEPIQSGRRCGRG
jgi:hypothetical protein